MTLLVSRTAPRSLKALEVLATADRWLRVRVSDGLTVYAIPSQLSPSAGYVVDVDSCTCPDFGLRQEPCKHVLAGRLHLERLNPATPRQYRAEPLNAASAVYDKLFPAEG